VLLRLVGVRATGLIKATGTGTQLALDERPNSWREAETAMEQITKRFGSGAVGPGSLIRPDSRKDGS
jgi:DNA polymerase-4